MKTKQNTSVITFTPSKVPFGDGKMIGIYKDESTDKIWFHGPDVARLLEYSKPSDMYRMVDDENKGAHIVRGVNRGVNQSCTSLSEAGFYQIALLSRTELGRKLMTYVCNELLPSIRKNGTYISDNASSDDIKYALENAIIDSVIASVRGETKRTGKLIKKLLDTKSLDSIRKESLEYMSNVLTKKKIKGSKDKLFTSLAKNTADWGNDKWVEKKLDMTDQYLIMSLLRDYEEKYNVFLKTSRAQSNRQLTAKIVNNQIVVSSNIEFSKLDGTTADDNEIF